MMDGPSTFTKNTPMKPSIPTSAVGDDVISALNFLGMALILGSAIFSQPARGELPIEQKEKAQKIGAWVREAGSLYKDGDFEGSGKRINDAISAINELIGSDSPEAFDAVSPLFSRITNAHALLELEGIQLLPFTRPDRPEDATKSPKTSAVAKNPAANSKTANDTAPEPEEMKPLASRAKSANRSRRKSSTDEDKKRSAAGPSFVREIGPILATHCGSCHINKSEGKFNMATYGMLAQGPPEGTVIFPGDPTGSRLIETIEQGDMPRGGGKVPEAQLRLLKEWIAAGAKYDGSSPLIPLLAMAASSPLPTTGQEMPAPPSDRLIRKPTGQETVSFAKDVAPILLKNCNGCHIGAMQPRGGLVMDNLAGISRGGDSGAIVLPKKSSESLLVRKLKGEEGDRMPAGGRPPLSEAEIAVISKWIDEDATFDGGSSSQPLATVASLAWAASASEEELSQRRSELAVKNMRLVTGGADDYVKSNSGNFFLIGNVSEKTAEVVLKAADKASERIEPIIDPSTIRGRVTIFAMPKRYDYSEFAKMVETRAVPPEWTGHWKHDGVDAYIAIIAGPSDSEEAIEARLIGPLASLAVSTRGSAIPRWLAEGLGRAVTAKLASRSFPGVEIWNQNLPTAVAALSSGKQFIEDGLAPEQSDLVGYAIVNIMLRSQRKQFESLLNDLGKGGTFDEVFTSAFGIKPADYVDAIRPPVAPKR